MAANSANRHGNGCGVFFLVSAIGLLFPFALVILPMSQNSNFLRQSQNSALPGVRGKGITSRMLAMPVTACTIRSPSSHVRERGFSQRIIFPAWAAAKAISQCKSLGAQISTASISFLATIAFQSVSVDA